MLYLELTTHGSFDFHSAHDLPAEAQQPLLPPHEREELERSLVRKLDCRMSILVLIYILNYIDRNNAAAARLRGFQEDLSISDAQFASVLSILYLGYLIMQIPSNILLNFTGKPSVYLPSCMIAWGLLSVFTGLAHNFRSVLTIRFFLGSVEAAFFPGALFMLSKWYKRDELGTRTAILQCGNLLSNAVGSLLASFILDGMDGVLGHSAWRWLFFIEGSLTVAVAILAIFVLPDFPSSRAKWLTPEEHQLAQDRLKEDAITSDENRKEDGGHLEGFLAAVRDWRVWWFALTLTSLVASLSFNAYFPTLVETFGFGTKVTLLLCAPPWTFASFAAWWTSRRSDRLHSRFTHIAYSLAIALLGFVVSVLSRNEVLRYLSFFLMAQSYSAFTLSMAWVSNTIIRPPNKRSVAVALINSVAQFGNIAGSYMWPRSWGHSYAASYTICIIANVVALSMCLVLRNHLRSQNEMLSRDERAKGQVVQGFRYFL